MPGQRIVQRLAGKPDTSNGKLPDTSLRVDLTRARSSRALKAFVASYVDGPEVYLAEPILFEVLRFANQDETRLLQKLFANLPTLSTPPDLWSQGVELGQICRRHGVTAGSLDLLIAVVAIHHDAEFITFDAGFEGICNVSPLRLTRLDRPDL